LASYRRIVNGIPFVLGKTMKDPPLTRYAINRVMQYAAPYGGEVRNEL
jgi:hypothetical protein